MLISIGMGRIPNESGQAGDLRVVVGPESLVADVHLRQAAVDLVVALVEPAADVLAVCLGRRDRLLTVGCQARLQRRSQAGAYLILLGLERLPVFPLVAGN